MGKKRFGQDYSDLGVFLRTTSTVHTFIHPYDAKFRNSTFKIFLISSVIFTAPIPSLIDIYEVDSVANFSLALLAYAEIVLVSGAVIVCFFWLACNSRKIEKVQKALADTHTLFQWKTLLQYNSRSMVAHDAFMFLKVAIYCGANSICRHTGANMIIGSVSYAVPMIAMHFFGASFRCVLHVLYAQFRHLNNILNSLKMDQVAYHEFLVYGHCLMSNTFKKLNAAYTLPAVLWSTCTLVVVVYNLYGILTFNHLEGFNESLGDNISGVSWMAFWITELIVLVVLLERVISEHEKFTAVLHLKMIRDPSGILSQSQKLATHIAMHQKIECSAAGFFNVDYRLIASIASVTTTYLIILIQFAQLSTEVQKTQDNTTKPTNQATNYPYYYLQN